MCAKQIQNSFAHSGNGVAEYAKSPIATVTQPTTEASGFMVMIQVQIAALAARLSAAMLAASVTRRFPNSSRIARNIPAASRGLTRIAQCEAKSARGSAGIIATVFQMFRGVGPLTAPRSARFGFGTKSITVASSLKALRRSFVLTSGFGVFERHEVIYLAFGGV